MNRASAELMMDHLDAAEIILLSSLMLRYPAINADAGRPAAYANALVDYMLEEVVDPARGIHTAIPVPWHDPDEAIALVERVAVYRGSSRRAW